MASARGYRHLCEIASGGMGRVYVAVRRGDETGTLFAVKRLHPHLREDERARRTFGAEASLAGDLDHPNVLRVIENGQDDEGPFLAMEYVEGCTLAELNAAIRRVDEEMPLQIALDTVRQIARGLHAVHDQGGLLVVHRDVSPQNILIDYDGVARLADFGIAKPLNPVDGRSSDTSTGMLKGKVGYMSPEQLRFETPDRRADLFALGVILWECLAGRRLYHGSEGTEGARRILHEPPADIMDEREDVPPDIVQLLFELLAKQPAARPPTAEVVADRLGAVVDELAADEGKIGLGDYTASFFERERRARRERIDAALERSRALEGSKEALGTAKTPGKPRAWHVKGAAIKATIEYLQARHGDEGFARVVEICSEETQAALAKPVLVSSWYEGDVMVDLTDAAQQLFGEGEVSLASQIGAASADYAFGDGGPYDVFRRQGVRMGVEPFLSTAAEIYKLYYDLGEWVIDELAETAAVIRIREGSMFPAGIADRIAGYLRRGLVLIGCPEAHVTSMLVDDDLILSARWRVG